MRGLSRIALACSVLIFAPAAAWAQNTSFGASVHMLVGQTPVRINLSLGAAYYDAPVVAGRSYCAEASGSDTELNPTQASISIFHSNQSPVAGTVDTGNLEPKGQTASRICFIATASDTPLFIVLTPAPGFENREYSLRFVETTLWANWFFTGGDYSSFTLLRNTTNAAITVDVRWIDATGAEKTNRLAQVVPANGLFFLDARVAMACPAPNPCAAVTGSVQVAHSASPEAIVGSQTTLSGSTGLSFDTLFFQRKTW